jgi:hypothetical protein
VNDVPPFAFKLWGQWLEKTPTDSTFRLISKMKDAIEVGGCPLARKMFSTPGVKEHSVGKVLLQMIDAIEEEMNK